jgi:hypothetical protein
MPAMAEPGLCTPTPNVADLELEKHLQVPPGWVLSLVAVSFGTICGATAADYAGSGLRWSEPQLGINWAG